jgi:hypothetical protein
MEVSPSKVLRSITFLRDCAQTRILHCRRNLPLCRLARSRLPGGITPVKSASIRQPHWHRHLDVKRPFRRSGQPKLPGSQVRGSVRSVQLTALKDPRTPFEPRLWITFPYWRLIKPSDPDEDFGQLCWSGDVRTMASLELNGLDAQLRFRDFARPRGFDRAVFRANDVGSRRLRPVR